MLIVQVLPLRIPQNNEITRFANLEQEIVRVCWEPFMKRFDI